jgi:hypothetical protein
MYVCVDVIGWLLGFLCFRNMIWLLIRDMVRKKKKKKNTYFEGYVNVDKSNMQVLFSRVRKA